MVKNECLGFHDELVVDDGGTVVVRHGGGGCCHGHWHREKRLRTQANLASRLGVPNDRANYYDELDHDHGSLAVVHTAARSWSSHYSMIEIKRKGRRGLGCSPRPQTLAKQVGVGVELAS